MSAGVSDQRMKGQGNQVTSCPKDHVNEHEDFDSWRSQHHQGYSTPISTSMASDPYTMSNYYGTSFPYQTFGVGDGTWSNGGDPMTFLGGYGGQMGHDSYGMEGMFGGGGGGFGNAFAQPTAPAAGFNYFHGNGDYSTWGSSAAMSRKPHYDDYYRGSEDGMYSAVDTLKGVEQGMQALGLSDQNVKVIDNKVDGKGDMSVQQTQVAPKKPVTWASVCSQPAKPTPQISSGGMKKKGPGMPPPPMVPGKHNMDIGTWEGKNGASASIGVKPVGPPPPQVRPGAWGGPIRGAGPAGPGGPIRFPTGPAIPHQVAILAPPHHHHPQQPMIAGPPPHQIPQVPPPPMIPPQQPGPPPSHPVLDELRGKNNYNPVDFDLSAKNARFFVIKSYSEDDIHRSIKYEIWCSTEHGNKRLDQAYRERENSKGVVYLFFSVNGSGHFCGMAKMVSSVDYHASSSVWSQDKWKGQFRVKWIYVKDVPNVQLRHIRLENNENKSVTNSRDTQEVPYEKGKQVLKVIHIFRHSTSIFDDFVHYEKRQEEEDLRKEQPTSMTQQQHSPGQNDRPPQPSQHHHKEREGGSGSGRGGGSRGGRGGVARNN